MEFDELKSIWKQGDQHFQKLDESAILTMLRGTSQSMVARMKRNVWIELIFTLVVGLSLLTYAFSLNSGALKYISISILLLFIVFIIYYIKKIRLLARFNTLDSDMLSALSRLITDLESYLRFYRNSYLYLYPVYFILGLTFGAYEKDMDLYLESLSRPGVLLALVTLIAVFYFAGIRVVNWALRKMYGNYIQKMKDLIKELNTPGDKL